MASHRHLIDLISLAVSHRCKASLAARIISCGLQSLGYAPLISYQGKSLPVVVSVSFPCLMPFAAMR